VKRVIVSGGFDPLHVGHLALLEKASELGAVVVIVDSDEYVRSKHPLMMPQSEREKLVGSLACVRTTVRNNTENGDCSGLLRILRPDYFVVGPDKQPKQLPEYATCVACRIPIIVIDSLKKDHSSRQYQVQPPSYNNPPVCCSVAVCDSEGRVLVGLRTDNRLHDLPGGFLEPGETLEQCTHRELKEEFGTCVDDLSYRKSAVTTYQDGRVVTSVFFLADVQGGDITAGPEMAAYRWIEADDPTLEVPDNWNNKQDLQFLREFFGYKS